MSLIEMVGYAVGVAVVFFAVIWVAVGVLTLQEVRRARQLDRQLKQRIDQIGGRG